MDTLPGNEMLGLAAIIPRCLSRCDCTIKMVGRQAFDAATGPCCRRQASHPGRVDASGVDVGAILGGFKAVSCGWKLKVLDQLQTPPEDTGKHPCQQRKQACPVSETCSPLRADMLYFDNRRHQNIPGMTLHQNRSLAIQAAGHDWPVAALRHSCCSAHRVHE